MTDIELIRQAVDRYADKLTQANDAIWGYAELAYEESKSAALLCGILEQEGFTVVKGVAGIPTSFTATFSSGTGKPVAGILGEYDALATLSQEAGCTVKHPVREGAPGHGCGHCCLGTGALGAALAVKEYLLANQKDGTVIYYGCAAEEGAGAKQFMARAGLFDGVDFVYTWHPDTKNEVSAKCSVAIMGANFQFHGITAHAGGCPHLGRSALDAAELMSVGVNYLREHMIDKARIHYAYVDAGGTAPNVVQDHSLVKYEVRAPKVSQMKELFERVVDVARGAALMTGTTMEYEITMAFSDYMPNDTLAKVAADCLKEVGAPEWSEADYQLAKAYLDSYDPVTRRGIMEGLAEVYTPAELEKILLRPLDDTVHPYHAANKEYESGSTDVGDVGYAVPTLELHVATACIGNVGHTWQMTAQAGSELGHKGLLVAAKALALSVIRTMESPEIREAAKAEFVRKTGGVYHCPLPDEVKPPIGRY
ncbi:MAG: amidohydrolase [Lachnospiraceae bacterium]|nr:amidohydrolase [Lachnospiraceae bacterium]